MGWLNCVVFFFASLSFCFFGRCEVDLRVPQGDGKFELGSGVVHEMSPSLRMYRCTYSFPCPLLLIPCSPPKLAKSSDDGDSGGASQPVSDCTVSSSGGFPLPRKAILIIVVVVAVVVGQCARNSRGRSAIAAAAAAICRCSLLRFHTEYPHP